MLEKKQMQEIQDLKCRGYTMGGIKKYYEEHGMKPPSDPTIRKYFKMDVVPVKPGEHLEKAKAFDVHPFKEAIIRVYDRNRGKDICMSSVYDVLLEMFVETGEYEALPGNEQTLRNYIHHLIESGQLTVEVNPKRIYDHVFTTPPGDQMLLDFGETQSEDGKKIHFLCLLLRYSRFLCVLAQNHKFNSIEACQAIYRCFCKIGGRPKTLVIDQDAVFVASETYGEVIETQVFKDFCTEQELTLYVCNKSDPESKGPIENSVKFVKTNFFSARKIESIEDVWRSLPGWLERKNKRIHKATYMVPVEVFNETEKEALQPLLPSAYETSPNTFTRTELRGTPYVLYKANRYSVPREYAYEILYYKVIAGSIHIYDKQYNIICTHALCESKGNYQQLPEHKKPENDEWKNIAERIKAKYNCKDFQHFINGLKKENGQRNLYKQLRALEVFLEKEKPDRALMSQVIEICCQNYRYQYSQFLTVYQTEKAKRTVPEENSTASEKKTEYRDLKSYTKAFADRLMGKV